MRCDNPIISRKVATTFMLPALVFVGVFLAFPAIWAIYIGLTNLTLTGRAAIEPKVVGFANFAAILRDPFFRNSLWITVRFVFGSAIVGQMVLGLTLALLLHNRKGVLKDIVSGVVILAWIIPEVVVAYLWVAFLDYDFGLLNSLRAAVGLRHLNWFFEHPVFSIILFNTWRGTAFSMLLLGAALQTIPPSYIETAEVIGASPWRKFRDIILPLIRPHLVTCAILVTIWTFNVFSPFLLTGGGPAFKTELLSIYTYRNAFKYFKLGYGSAISTLILLINLTLATVYMRLARARRA
ncbi:MAG: sugar ABC transporter permease [Bacillota bacterium]